MYPPGVHVTGIDHSHEMLAKAALRVQQRRLGQTQALVQMDVEHMAFPDAGFDKAAALFAMAGLPDPVRAMREIERVCRLGATIVIVSHFLSRWPLLRVFDRLLWPILTWMHSSLPVDSM